MGRRSRSRSPKRHSKKRDPSPQSDASDNIRKSKKTTTPSKHGVETRSKCNSHSNQSSPGSRKNSMINGDNQTEVASSNPGDFSKFPEISPTTVTNLQKVGILGLFPVQYMTFRNVYAREDLIVRDLTGSGKTLGFCLPIVEYLRAKKLFGTKCTQAIVLAPTRELALQISRVLNDLKHHDREFNVLTVYGGVSIDEQTYQLRKGVDVFVGTTGRVLDHINRGNLNFSQLKFMVLDEADEMLKMGFKEDVDQVLHAVKDQNKELPTFLLFSATVPRWIKDMANQYLKPNW
jgi:superfamily II DNA/RNA helicase